MARPSLLVPFALVVFLSLASWKAEAQLGQEAVTDFWTHEDLVASRLDGGCCQERASFCNNLESKSRCTKYFRCRGLISETEECDDEDIPEGNSLVVAENLCDSKGCEDKLDAFCEDPTSHDKCEDFWNCRRTEDAPDRPSCGNVLTGEAPYFSRTWCMEDDKDFEEDPCASVRATWCGSSTEEDCIAYALCHYPTFNATDAADYCAFVPNPTQLCSEWEEAQRVLACEDEHDDFCDVVAKGTNDTILDGIGVELQNTCEAFYNCIGDGLSSQTFKPACALMARDFSQASGGSLVTVGPVSFKCKCSFLARTNFTAVFVSIGLVGALCIAGTIAVRRRRNGATSATKGDVKVDGDDDLVSENSSVSGAWKVPSKKWTREERQAMASKLNLLSQEQMEGVVKVIRSHEKYFEDDPSKELEVNLHELDGAVLDKLEEHLSEVLVFDKLKENALEGTPGAENVNIRASFASAASEASSVGGASAASVVPGSLASFAVTDKKRTPSPLGDKKRAASPTKGRSSGGAKGGGRNKSPVKSRGGRASPVKSRGKKNSVSSGRKKSNSISSKKGRNKSNSVSSKKKTEKKAEKPAAGAMSAAELLAARDASEAAAVAAAGGGEEGEGGKRRSIDDDFLGGEDRVLPISKKKLELGGFDSNVAHGKRLPEGPAGAAQTDDYISGATNASHIAMNNARRSNGGGSRHRSGSRKRSNSSKHRSGSGAGAAPGAGGRQKAGSLSSKGSRGGASGTRGRGKSGSLSSKGSRGRGGSRSK